MMYDHQSRFMAKYCDRWCYFGSPSPATTQTTTSNAPWSGAVPYINTGLQSASDLYAAGGPQYYPGQTYAPENAAEQAGATGLSNIQSQFAPTLTAAQGDMTNAGDISQTVAGQDQGIAGQTAANNPSNSFFSGLATGSNSIPGLSTLNNYSNGSMLSAQNPYFQQMAGQVIANTLPEINAQFANSGRGNSGLAASAAAQGVGNAVGGLAYQNYQQGLGQQQSAADTLAGLSEQGAQGLGANYQNSISNQLNAGSQQLSAGNLGLSAAQLGPLLQSMGINAATAGLTGGQAQQTFDQQPITAAMNQYNYNAALPYTNLQNYIANITGQIGGTGTSTSSGTSTPAQPSFFNQLLGAGATAASFFA